jgi:asparaginyl-tRNA synthetase
MALVFQSLVLNVHHSPSPIIKQTYPLQKKAHSLEFLRSLPHLRARTNTIGAVLRLRSAAANSIHQYFLEQDFINVHTPILTALDCEGAGELFCMLANHHTQFDVIDSACLVLLLIEVISLVSNDRID